MGPEPFPWGFTGGCGEAPRSLSDGGDAPEAADGATAVGPKGAVAQGLVKGERIPAHTQDGEEGREPGQHPYQYGDSRDTRSGTSGATLAGTLGDPTASPWDLDLVVTLRAKWSSWFKVRPPGGRTSPVGGST
ncbi:hypothetical protein JCM13210_09920 [Thermaerobacter litoralis]